MVFVRPERGNAERAFYLISVWLFAGGQGAVFRVQIPAAFFLSN